jgi:hypothetical protein
MLGLISVSSMMSSHHSDTSHNVNHPGKQKCETGLPQLLLQIYSLAKILSQIQPDYDFTGMFLVEGAKEIPLHPNFISFC